MHEASIVALVVPLISAIATIITVVVSNRSNDKVQDALLKAQLSDLKNDLCRIEDKLEEMNDLAKLVYCAEEKISVLEQRVKSCEEKMKN